MTTLLILKIKALKFIISIVMSCYTCFCQESSRFYCYYKMSIDTSIRKICFNNISIALESTHKAFSWINKSTKVVVYSMIILFISWSLQSYFSYPHYININRSFTFDNHPEKNSMFLFEIINSVILIMYTCTYKYYNTYPLSALKHIWIIHLIISFPWIR